MMSYDLVIKLLDDVRTWRPSITLFGGEPMLHPDCTGIIRAIKERGMHCLMITNGSLIERHAAELAESGLDELNVSIDGRGQVHDEIRQSSGLYARVISGLSGVRSARRGKRKPFINIQCTISRFNQHALHEMAAVAREAGADSLTLHHLIFIDETVRSPHTGRDNGLGRMREHWEGFPGSAGIDVPLVWREIRSLRRAIRQARFDVYPDFTRSQMREYYAHRSSERRPPSRRRGCKSPWVCAYVFPDGALRPCLNFSYSFGSVADDSIGKLWNGAAAQAYRRRLKQEKSFPACERCTELFRY